MARSRRKGVARATTSDLLDTLRHAARDPATVCRNDKVVERLEEFASRVPKRAGPRICLNTNQVIESIDTGMVARQVQRQRAAPKKRALTDSNGTNAVADDAHPPVKSEKRPQKRARGGAAGATPASRATGGPVAREVLNLPPGNFNAGFIRRVHLENFMSHKNFTMDFGPHVTFISGHNGSGKSATLQALQSCLGVRASQTGRGTKAGNFVRRGCHSARIVVVLSNAGEEAHEPETYGDTISVERRIDAKGGGSFTIRDAWGRKVGSRAKDLSRILDHLNLMVSNPCVVMTQDISRTFLSGDTDDAKRYKLFMQATMLDAVYHNMMLTNNILEKMDGMIDEKEKEAKQAEEVWRAAKKKMDEALDVETYRELIDAVESWLSWDEIVYVYERKLDAWRHRIETLIPEKLKEYHDIQAKKEEDLREARANQRNMQNTFKEYKARTNELQDVFKLQKTDLLALHKQFIHMENSLQKSKNQEEEHLAKERDIVEMIEGNAGKKDVAGTQEVRDKHEAQLARAHEKRDALERQKRGLEEEKESLDAKLRSAQAQCRAVDAERMRVLAQMRKLQDVLASVRGGAGAEDRVTANTFSRGHGQNLDALLREIGQSQRNFHHVPVGPIGLHLKLLDRKWDKAVEAAVGNILGCFIVHDEHDQRELRQCAYRARAGMVPTVYVMRFDRRRIEIPRERLHPGGYPTIASVLTCTHRNYQDVIWNTLIDHGRIERTVLVEDFEQGKQAIFHRKASPAFRGYDKDCLLMEIRGSTQVNRNVWERWMRPRLSVAKGNTKRYESDLTNQLNEHEREFERLGRELSQHKQNERNIQRELDEVFPEMQTVGNALNRSQYDVQVQMTQIAESLEEAGAIDDDGLETELNAVRVSVMEARQHTLKLEAKLSEIREERNKAQVTTEQTRKEILTAQANSNASLQSIENVDAIINELVAEVNYYKKEVIPILERKVEASNKKYEAKKVEYEEKSAIVEEEMCKREDLPAVKKRLLEAFPEMFESGDILLGNKEEREKLEGTHRKLRVLVKRREADAGSFEQLEYEHQVALKEAELQQKRLKQLREPHEMIDDGIAVRWKKFSEMRKSIQKQISFDFGSFMGKRGHSGKIKFDTQGERLKLEVRLSSKEKGSKKNVVKDMKSLSGGERSLSTLAFVLALGNQCESPFRASDEFDVFMDAVNRKVSLRTLLHFAVDKGQQTQLILLTPQDISAGECAMPCDALRCHAICDLVRSCRCACFWPLC